MKIKSSYILFGGAALLLYFWYKNKAGVQEKSRLDILTENFNDLPLILNYTPEWVLKATTPLQDSLSPIKTLTPPPAIFTPVAPSSRGILHGGDIPLTNWAVLST